MARAKAGAVRRRGNAALAAGVHAALLWPRGLARATGGEASLSSAPEGEDSP
ncbi:MAG: hypothetical protein H5T71_06195, partial [Chloroflexi bacterium]|nr:hypothetical protein [Chloroflexota bacterium]